MAEKPSASSFHTEENWQPEKSNIATNCLLAEIELLGARCPHLLPHMLSIILSLCITHDERCPPKWPCHPICLVNQITVFIGFRQQVWDDRVNQYCIVFLLLCWSRCLLWLGGEEQRGMGCGKFASVRPTSELDHDGVCVLGLRGIKDFLYFEIILLAKCHKVKHIWPHTVALPWLAFVILGRLFKLSEIPSLPVVK